MKSRYHSLFSIRYPLLWVLILFTIFYSLSTVAAQAASLGFFTNKSLFESEILPGTTYRDSFTIMNESDGIALPIHLQLSLWNLKDNTEEDIEYVSSEGGIDATQWFYLELPRAGAPRDPILQPLSGGYDLILDPAEGQEIAFRVKPPKDVAAGTYLVTMRLQPTLPEHYFEASGPRFIPELDILFFFRVPYFSIDDMPSGYSAEVISLGWSNERDGSAGGIVPVAEAGVLEDVAKTLVAQVRNNGAFYFKAVGKVEMRNWWGTLIKSIPLPGRYLLPDRTRSLAISFTEHGEDENLFEGAVSYVKDSTYFGRYTATLILQYPDSSRGDQSGFTGGTVVSETVSFWVFPWKLMLIVAGILALLTIFVKQFGRRIALALGVLFSFGKKLKRSNRR